MREVALRMRPFAGTDWFRNISEWTSGEITRLRTAASDGPTLSLVPSTLVPSTPRLLVPLVGGPSAATPSPAASPPVEDGPSLFGGHVSSSAPPSAVPPTRAPTPAVMRSSPAVVDDIPQSLSAGAPVDVAAAADPEFVVIEDPAVDAIVVDEPACAAEDGSPAAVLFQRPPSPDVEEIPWVHVRLLILFYFLHAEPFLVRSLLDSQGQVPPAASRWSQLCVCAVLQG